MIKELLFRWYGWLGTIAIGVCAYAAAQLDSIDWPTFLTMVGSILGFVYFVQRQKLAELKLFEELFVGFNHRYDVLNERLMGMLCREALTEADRETLNDYFNLCGEEYLWYSQGYVPRKVWKSWRSGMKFYLEHPLVAPVWAKERKAGSFYGLEKLRL